MKKDTRLILQSHHNNCSLPSTLSPCREVGTLREPQFSIKLTHRVVAWVNSITRICASPEDFIKVQMPVPWVQKNPEIMHLQKCPWLWYWPMAHTLFNRFYTHKVHWLVRYSSNGTNQLRENKTEGHCENQIHRIGCFHNETILPIAGDTILKLWKTKLLW